MIGLACVVLLLAAPQVGRFLMTLTAAISILERSIPLKLLLRPTTIISPITLPISILIFAYSGSQGFPKTML